MSGASSGRNEEPDLVTDNTEAVSLNVDVGIVVAYAPETEPNTVESFAMRLAVHAVDELAAITDLSGRFHLEEPSRLPDNDRRRSSAFLDRATH